MAENDSVFFFLMTNVGKTGMNIILNLLSFICHVNVSSNQFIMFIRRLEVCSCVIVRKREIMRDWVDTETPLSVPIANT